MSAGTGRPSRRQILKRAVGLGGVALLGSAVLAGAGSAAAAVASSKRFDLTDASDEWFREILLQDVRILQSFSFDNANKHLYTVQLVQAGRQLPGESRTFTGTERETNGDLCVTRLDWQGYIIGRMYLRGFGHGVSIAAEPSGNSAYLWTETNALARSGSACSSRRTRSRPSGTCGCRPPSRSTATRRSRRRPTSRTPRPSRTCGRSTSSRTT
jgi:hypothetical protein